MTIRNAVIKGGQIILDHPIPLPDGTKVTLRLDSKGDQGQHPLLFMASIAQPTGISDLADQHDHYIYGTRTPKKYDYLAEPHQP